jgi:HSF-type DNA-binding
MEILSTEEYHDIICWLPHGKGFLIVDKTRFANDVLPKHFKQAKYTSFTRKLNRWYVFPWYENGQSNRSNQFYHFYIDIRNFIRVTRGPEVGSYYHPYFQKDQRKLVLQMTCIGSKQSQSLKPLDPIALGVAPMGGEGEQSSTTQQNSSDGVQQWRPQDHERYRLFYQQHHWNYMMQMMQASAQPQVESTTAADIESKQEEGSLAPTAAADKNGNDDVPSDTTGPDMTTEPDVSTEPNKQATKGKSENTAI